MFGKHPAFSVLGLCALASGCGALGGTNEHAGVYAAGAAPSSGSMGEGRSVTLAEALGVPMPRAEAFAVSDTTPLRTLHVDLGRTNVGGNRQWAGLAIRAPRASWDAMAYDVGECWRVADAERPDPPPSDPEVFDPTDRLSAASANEQTMPVAARLALRADLDALKGCLSQRGYAGVLLSEPPHTSNGPFNPDPNAPPYAAPSAAIMQASAPAPVEPPVEAPTPADEPRVFATNDVVDAPSPPPPPAETAPVAMFEPAPAATAEIADPSAPAEAPRPRRAALADASVYAPIRPPANVPQPRPAEPVEAVEAVEAQVAPPSSGPQRLNGAVAVSSVPSPRPRPTPAPAPQPEPVAPVIAPAPAPEPRRMSGLPTLEEYVRWRAGEPVRGRDTVFVPLDD